MMSVSETGKNPPACAIVREVQLFHGPRVPYPLPSLGADSTSPPLLLPLPPAAHHHFCPSLTFTTIALDSVDSMSGSGAGSLANSVVFTSETSAIVAAM